MLYYELTIHTHTFGKVMMMISCYFIYSIGYLVNYKN